MKDSQPIYRVLQPVILSTDRQIYLPGAIVDLSHLPEESIRWFVQQGIYETADGEPENKPQPIENSLRERNCCNDEEQ
jgi:hypothetical protein